MMRSFRLISLLYVAAATMTAPASPYLMVLSEKSPGDRGEGGAADGSLRESFGDHLVVGVHPMGPTCQGATQA
jgi:hypothetical protein